MNSLIRARARNGQHAMKGLFRQSVFGRLGGYEDVNDADRLGRDPAMRWIVGGRAVANVAASTSQMGRFETEFLATGENLAALANLSGQWIDRVHVRHPPKAIVLDMDSSVSPTRHGRYVTFQLAEVAVPRGLFRKILRLINGLRPAPLPP